MINLTKMYSIKIKLIKHIPVLVWGMNFVFINMIM